MALTIVAERRMSGGTLTVSVRVTVRPEARSPSSQVTTVPPGPDKVYASLALANVVLNGSVSLSRAPVTGAPDTPTLSVYVSSPPGATSLDGSAVLASVNW